MSTSHTSEIFTAKLKKRKIVKSTPTLYLSEVRIN